MNTARRWTIGAIGAALALAGGSGLWAWQQRRQGYALPPGPAPVPVTPALPPPTAGMRVFHLGHSLVGRDMPAFVEQLANAAGLTGHGHHSQLGWGASLRDHWDPAIEVAGFDVENAHPRFRPAREAIASGAYDAVILTEMVELRDAIRWHESPVYLHRWAQAARAARPDVRLYLYETWHNLAHPDGWLNRLDRDATALWQDQVLALAWGDPDLGPVHVIPAGRVLAALTRALPAEGPLPGLTTETDLFARNPDGSLDTIHLNDQGHYLIALIHFATLYHRSPLGLPHALRRADGSPATPPSDAAAALMQRIAWQVVRDLPVTGVSP
jgi:hypothetical protein